ncbi:MAG: cupin domain-containing protein, partial [Gammaproteobacteria bacterium]|nr:cupin domain-containing protein [Gammaproteobacteria bacterium]
YAMRTSVWLAAIGHASADISAAAELAVANGEWDGAFFRPEREAFINSPSQSLDYAVMEKLVRAFGSAAWRDSLGRAIGAAVVEMEAGWADVGTWHALLQTQADSTADGNATLGDVVDIGNENCVLVSTSRLVAGVGLRDIVAVETPDAVLVAHRRDGERVAEVVKQLREGGRSEADVHRRAHRPWGSAEPLDEGEGHRVQHLVIHPGESITLQVHERRTEHWTVVRGQATVERDGVVHRLDRGQAMTIPPGAQHRLENAADEPLEVIEVQTGDLDRGDIQRLTAS